MAHPNVNLLAEDLAAVNLGEPNDLRKLRNLVDMVDDKYTQLGLVFHSMFNLIPLGLVWCPKGEHAFDGTPQAMMECQELQKIIELHRMVEQANTMLRVGQHEQLPNFLATATTFFREFREHLCCIETAIEFSYERAEHYAELSDRYALYYPRETITNDSWKCSFSNNMRLRGWLIGLPKMKVLLESGLKEEDAMLQIINLGHRDIADLLLWEKDHHGGNQRGEGEFDMAEDEAPEPVAAASGPSLGSLALRPGNWETVF